MSTFSAPIASLETPLYSPLEAANRLVEAMNGLVFSTDREEILRSVTLGKMLYELISLNEIPVASLDVGVEGLRQLLDDVTERSNAILSGSTQVYACGALLQLDEPFSPAVDVEEEPATTRDPSSDQIARFEKRRAENTAAKKHVRRGNRVAQIGEHLDHAAGCHELNVGSLGLPCRGR